MTTDAETPEQRPTPRLPPPKPKLKVVPVAQDVALIDDLVAFIRSYVVVTDAQALVLAYYVAHTHLIEHCEQTPYVNISSPERECGKSRLMEVLEQLVARPWMVVNPSEAVLFRMVDSTKPTLLWDEIDTVFAPKTAPQNEEKRGLLDQGHRRFGKVPRFIGNGVVEFNVFCPKVLAGIGTLPDTIASRSIPIRLSRRKVSEPISDFLRRDVEPLADKLRGRVEDWAAKNAERVAEARPDMPLELSDRMREGCESLVAVADLFGEGVGASLRSALVELLAVAERVDAQGTMRMRLLRDLHAVFEGRNWPKFMSTESIITQLCQIEEGNWSRYYNRVITPSDIANLLKQYEIEPRPGNVKLKTGEWKSKRGYYRADLADAWERYLRMGTE